LPECFLFWKIWGGGNSSVHFLCFFTLLVLCRIPFAAANMTTAITAIKANAGVTVVACGFTIIAGLWFLLWSLAVSSSIDKSTTNPECDPTVQGQTCPPAEPAYGIMFLLFLSFFFTHQVIQNSVHVTVAGVVGSWWVAPAENGCCGATVCNSFIRTVTTSFGSVCFGVRAWLCSHFLCFPCRIGTHGLTLHSLMFSVVPYCCLFESP